MINMSRLLTLLVFLIASCLNVLGQAAGFKAFKGDGFEIFIPQKWNTGMDGAVYNFYLDPALGDISVSVHKNLDLSSEVIESTILGLNEKRKGNERVIVLQKGKITEYNYEYINDGIKWLIRGVRSKNDFFLVTLNWKLSSWEANKDSLMKSRDSFTVQ